MGVWGASVSELPWFGQFGEYRGHPGYPPQMVAQPQYTGNVIHQLPGHEVIIENGQVRQVPTGMPISPAY
ncbi:hypothetical protein FS837_002807 [Tulasnella sp. UAMH 9824]|nr:hypothetical protein FS837_002807 [Tulasnella sp. UAMH 9824]